ncbi:MAG: hypothetical protein JRM73_00065 [Nitrososphaerota archaeon]|nr:hypothetical protein [Nitrososphaerota archaeon]
MKPKTPGGIWALRGISVLIALVVIGAILAVGFSAYQDYSGIKSEISSGNKPVSGIAVYNVTSGVETVSFNVTVPNRGLLMLNVTMSCSTSSAYVSCRSAQAEIPPGGEGALHFVMTVTDVKQFLSSTNRQVNGTIAMSLVPFVSLSIGLNFTKYVQLPGAV